MKHIQSIVLLFLLLCSIGKLAASDYHCIQINGSKISLRYSNRAEIEKILGVSHDVKAFEFGGEGFNWSNFIVCSYNEGKLSFNYDDNGNIIRITVNSRCDYTIVLHGELIKNISFDAILGKINKKSIRDLYTSSEFIMYTKTEGVSSVEYSYWFNNEGNITWFDMYYSAPW
jgi:hypothetical protein